MKRYGTIILGAFVLTLAMGAPSAARANQAQRLIVDAGVNLGLWQVQVQLFDTPATDPTMISYATFAFDAITQLVDLVVVVQTERDEAGTWILSSTVRQCSGDDGGPLTSSDGFHTWAISGNRMSHWFRYPHPPDPTDNEQHFDLTVPPGSLRPGETVDLHLVTTGGGSNPSISGETLAVWTYLGEAEHRAHHFLREDADANRITSSSIGFGHGGGVREGTARIPVPAAAGVPFTIFMTMESSNGAVAWGQWGCVIRWVYEVR